MKENQYLVLGTSRYTNENGRVGTTLHLATPFTAWQSEKNECMGYAVETQFTYAEIPNLKQNDVIEINWTKGYQGKAVIGSVNVVSVSK